VTFQVDVPQAVPSAERVVAQRRGGVDDGGRVGGVDLAETEGLDTAGPTGSGGYAGDLGCGLLGGGGHLVGVGAITSETLLTRV
jgi:hypothetical protein